METLMMAVDNPNDTHEMKVLMKAMDSLKVAREDGWGLCPVVEAVRRPIRAALLFSLRTVKTLFSRTNPTPTGTGASKQEHSE